MTLVKFIIGLIFLPIISSRFESQGKLIKVERSMNLLSQTAVVEENCSVSTEPECLENFPECYWSSGQCEYDTCMDAQGFSPVTCREGCDSRWYSQVVEGETKTYYYCIKPGRNFNPCEDGPDPEGMVDCKFSETYCLLSTELACLENLPECYWSSGQCEYDTCMDAGDFSPVTCREGCDSRWYSQNVGGKTITYYYCIKSGRNFNPCESAPTELVDCKISGTSESSAKVSSVSNAFFLVLVLILSLFL